MASNARLRRTLSKSQKRLALVERPKSPHQVMRLGSVLGALYMYDIGI